MTEVEDMRAFADKHGSDGVWNPRGQYVLHNAVSSRFLVTVEYLQHPYALDCWRNDLLLDAGIDTFHLDADSFADQLLDTIGYHMSPHELSRLYMKIKQRLNADDWYLSDDGQLERYIGDRNETKGQDGTEAA